MSNADAPADDYFKALLPLRGVGTDETSGYDALASLFNAVGQKLRPKVKTIIHPKNTGAGIPDGGFFTPDQLKNAGDAVLLQLLPSRGALEVKPLRPISQQSPGASKSSITFSTTDRFCSLTIAPSHCGTGRMVALSPRRVLPSRRAKRNSGKWLLPIII